MRTVLLVLFIFIQSRIFSSEKLGWTQFGAIGHFQSAASSDSFYWIGTYGNGLLRISISNSDLTLFTNTNSDLPSNIIYDVAVGIRGETWLATEEGLASFDGSTWQVYHRHNSPLINHRITAVAVDSSSKVWVASENGIHCLDGKLWTDVLDRNPGFPANLMSNVNKIQCLPSGIWLHHPRGLVRFKEGSWKAIQTQYGYSRSYAVSKDGTFWSVSSSDISGVNEEQIITLPLPTSDLGNLVIDSQDYMWFVSYNFIYKRISGDWLPLSLPFTLYNTNDCQADKYGAIWLNDGRLVYRFNTLDQKIKHYSLPQNIDVMNRCSSLLAESDDMLWGISSFYLNARVGNEWVQCIPKPDMYLQVRNFAQDNENRLTTFSESYYDDTYIIHCSIKTSAEASSPWITNEYSIKKEYHASHTQSCFSRPLNAWYILVPINSITSDIISFDGTYWERLSNQGLFKFNEISILEADYSGSLWAALNDGTLYRYYKSSWQRIHLPTITDTIDAIIPADGDTIWVGIRNRGLARYDGSGWNLFDSTQTGYSNLKPLYYDRVRKEVWCKASINHRTFQSLDFSFSPAQLPVGLYSFNGKEGQLYTTHNSGLIDSDINAVVTIPDGLWVASGNGLAFWNRAQSPVLPHFRIIKRNTKSHFTRKICKEIPLKLNLNTSAKLTFLFLT